MGKQEPSLLFALDLKNFCPKKEKTREIKMSLATSVRTFGRPLITFRRQFSNTIVKVGAAQVPRKYVPPSGLKAFAMSAIAGLVMGLPVMALYWLLPTEIQMDGKSFAFVANPKAPIANPNYGTARYNEDGVPMSPGGEA